MSKAFWFGILIFLPTLAVLIIWLGIILISFIITKCHELCSKYMGWVTLALQKLKTSSSGKSI